MEFVGLSTKLAGRVSRVDGGEVEIETAYGAIRAAGRYMQGARVIAAVRPELVAPTAGDGSGATNTISVPLQDVMCLGSKTHLYGAASGDDRVVAELSGTAPLTRFAPGNRISLSWPAAATLVYPADPT